MLQQQQMQQMQARAGLAPGWTMLLLLLSLLLLLHLLLRRSVWVQEAVLHTVRAITDCLAAVASGCISSSG